MHFDASQTAFMGGLGKSPAGQQLKALIKACIEDSNVNLRKMSGEQLLREQGRAIMLDDLAGLLDPRAAPPRDLSRVVPRRSLESLA